MAIILVVLPLYYIPRNGYYKLGDTKYFLYRNVSLSCMGICLVTELIDIAGNCRMENHECYCLAWRKNVKKLIGWCREHATVSAVFLYGICAVISAACSPYGKTAWTGEQEWYMGAVTICLMVGGFLIAARYAGQCENIMLLGEAAFVTVTLIGLLQKLGYDPLGLLKDYVVGDWEYTHMLTTLGNNNWLSGYYSVMFPLSLALFCKAAEEGRRVRAFIFGACNALAAMLLFLQGSDGGVMVASVALWLNFWLNRKHSGMWKPLLLLLTAICTGMFLLGKGVQTFGTYNILLQEGIAKKMVVWHGWLPLAAVCLIFYGICHVLPENKKKTFRFTLLYSSLVIAFLIAIWYILSLWGSSFAEWGSSRGRLWQLAWQGFCKADLRQKLLGVGPDCFADYLEQVVPGGTVLFDTGYFAGSIFTNAHNEWLTTLVNMGLLGVAAYAGVFATALRCYKNNFLASVLVITYGMHSIISFQQVLNTPLFFLLLGVCEAGQTKINMRSL